MIAVGASGQIRWWSTISADLDGLRLDPQPGVLLRKTGERVSVSLGLLQLVPLGDRDTAARDAADRRGVTAEPRQLSHRRQTLLIDEPRGFLLPGRVVLKLTSKYIGFPLAEIERMSSAGAGRLPLWSWPCLEVLTRSPSGVGTCIGPCAM